MRFFRFCWHLSNNLNSAAIIFLFYLLCCYVIYVVIAAILFHIWYIFPNFQSDNVVSPEDVTVLADVVSSPNLIRETEYFEILKNYFSEIKIEDLSEKWTGFTAKRSEIYNENLENLEKIHEPAAVRSYKIFYDSVADLFSRKVIRGIVVTAKKL